MTVPERRDRWLILVMGTLTGLGPLSIDMYLPAFPALAAEMAADPSAIQLTLATFTIGLAVGQLLAGPLSDAVGRKWPLMVGLGVYAVAGVSAALAPSVPVLATIRFAQGLGAAAGIVIARAVVRDRFSGAALARFFSLLMLVNAVTPIVGPLLGSQLLRVVSWRGTFVVLAVTGVVLLLAVARIEESLPPSARRGGGLAATRDDVRSLLGDGRFAGYVLVAALPFASLFAYISGSTFVLQGVFGLSVQEFGLVFGINSLGTLLAGAFNTRLLTWFSAQRLLGAGLIVLSVSGLGVLVSAVGGIGLPGLLVCLFLVMAGIGLILPNATTLALDPQGTRAGSASALLGVVQSLAGGIAAPLVGSGGVGTAVPMGVTIAVPALLALAVGHVVLTADGRRGQKSTSAV